MKLLLTNDDGVYSVGIQTMAKRLAEAGHDLLVVAPDRERSGAGHSMTLARPVYLRDADKRLFCGDIPAKACDGTPTDCISMGIDVLGFDADMVISGINQGPNLADDITYSGTVCAAMEGLIFGRPSLAVSLVSSSKHREIHNETAAAALMGLMEWISKEPMPEGVLYNVNVPNLPLSELKGVRVTRKGIRRYVDKIKTVKSPSGEETYWIGGHIDDVLEDDTDVNAVKEGYVSVTPIQLDMTCFRTFERDRRGPMARTLSDFLRKQA